MSLCFSRFVSYYCNYILTWFLSGDILSFHREIFMSLLVDAMFVPTLLAALSATFTCFFSTCHSLLISFRYIKHNYLGLVMISRQKSHVISRDGVVSV